MDDVVIVGSSDGCIRRLRLRPNQYLDVIGRCDDGVTSLVEVPDMEGWIVSSSGSKIAFWDTNASEHEDNEKSSEDDKPRKKKKKKKRGTRGETTRNSNIDMFFADL